MRLRIYIKWLGGLVLAFVVLAAVLFAVLSNYEFEDLKPRIVKAVKDKTGRDLTLAGELSLEIGFQPALVVEDVGFANAAWGSRPQMIRVKRLEIQVAPIPLLKRQVELKRLILIEPDILIETNTDGESNFVFRTADQTAQPESATTPADSSLPPLVLIFQEIQIRKGRLVYKDGLSGEAYSMQIHAMEATAAPGGMVSLNIDGGYNGIACTIAGKVGDLRSAVNPAGSWPVDVTIAAVGTTAAVRGTILDPLSGEGLHLTIEAKGRSVPELLSPFGITQAPDLGSFRVSGQITNPKGKWTGRHLDIHVGSEGMAQVEATGIVDDLTALKGMNLFVKGNGPSLSKLLHAFHVSNFPDIGPFLVAGNLANPVEKFQVTNLDLKVGAGSPVEIALSGSVADIVDIRGIDADFSARGDDLGKLEAILAKPLFATGSFDVSGHCLAPSLARFDLSNLQVATREGDLAGSATIEILPARPRLKAALSSNRLDLRTFFPADLKEKKAEAEKGNSESGIPDENRVFSSAPLQLEFLRLLDLDLDLQAKDLLLPFASINKLTTRIQLNDGHLAVTPIEFLFGDGSLAGRCIIHPQQDPFSPDLNLKTDLNLKVVRFDMGKILDELGMAGLVEGAVDIDMNVRSRGNSVAALMAGLSGKTAIVIKEGRVNDRFITLLGGDLSATLLSLIKTSSNKDPFTNIHCWVTGLEIQDGSVQTKALVLDTTDVTLVGHGKVDLKTEALDLSAAPSPKKGLGIKGLGKVSLSIGELAKPFKMGGTLADPTWAVDTKSTLVTIGKAVGGAALLGPVGLAAALTTGKLGADDPCNAALSAVQDMMATVPDSPSKKTNP